MTPSEQKSCKELYRLVERLNAEIAELTAENARLRAAVEEGETSIMELEAEIESLNSNGQDYGP